MRTPSILNVRPLPGQNPDGSWSPGQIYVHLDYRSHVDAVPGPYLEHPHCRTREEANAVGVARGVAWAREQYDVRA